MGGKHMEQNNERLALKVLMKGTSNNYQLIHL